MDKLVAKWFVVFMLFVCTQPAAAGDRHNSDPHYTAAGFFDIHVCNWPDRAPFYLVLFSTTRFNEIESIRVATPQKRQLTELDLSRYRNIVRKGKPLKRVFMLHVPIADKAVDGWFEARVQLKDGSEIAARDYVEHHLLGRAQQHHPADGETLADVPVSLSWEAIDGAGFYQVFIRDMWNDGKLIHSSRLIEHNHYRLPQGLLQPGGYYTWKVHARDINEDVRLGDFNLGSQSEWVEFSIE